MSDELQIVVRLNGVETDVTEAVKVCYDVVHSSMDWGSGFLDVEEMAHVVALAQAAGFTEPDVPFARYTPAQGRAVKQRTADIRAAFKSIPVVRP